MVAVLDIADDFFMEVDRSLDMRMSRIQRLRILILVLIVAFGIELIVESPFGDSSLWNLKSLYNVFVGGLFVLIRNQLFPPELLMHTIPILIAAYAVGLAAWWLMKKVRSNKYLVWSIVGLVVVVVTFLARLKTTPLFADLSSVPAKPLLLMGASGMVSGAVLARFVQDLWPEAGRTILGLSLGTLYHFELARTWTYTSPGIWSVIIGVGEFLAPVAFGLLFGVYFRKDI